MSYEDFLRHRAGLITLGNAVQQYSRRLAPTLPLDSVDNFAGALRDVLPGFINEFGSASGALGVAYYADQRAQARVAGRFIPTIAPLEIQKNTNTAVSFLAKTYVDNQGAIGPIARNLGEELQRSVIGVERRTIYRNATNDSAVTQYQRVAGADACEFCSMVAFEPRLSREYPEQYHRNCYCTVEPVFRGQQAIRPEYYDTFGDEYYEAVSKLGPNQRSTEEILSQVRKDRLQANKEANARMATQ